MVGSRGEIWNNLISEEFWTPEHKYLSSAGVISHIHSKISMNNRFFYILRMLQAKQAYSHALYGWTPLLEVCRPSRRQPARVRATRATYVGVQPRTLVFATTNRLSRCTNDIRLKFKFLSNLEVLVDSLLKVNVND